MENIKLISSYDCLIVTQDEHIFLEADQTLEIPDNTVLSIYPTGKTGRQAFCLNSAGSAGNSFFDCFDAPDGKIFFLTNAATCENFCVHNLTLGGNDCRVEIGQSQIAISYLQFKKVVTLNESFDRYTISQEGDNVAILLTGGRTQDLFLFEPSGKLSHLSGEEIKLSGKSVFVTKNLDDVARHSVSEEYFFTPDGLSKTGQQIDYQNGRPVVVQSAQTVPYAFLQALQVEDASLAATYLDLPMRRRIDQTHLLAFFGKINYFHPLAPDLYLVSGSEQKGLFKFAMQDNKICEITAI